MESRHRWLIKKAVRTGVLLGSWSTGAITLVRRSAAARVRALTYHRFGESQRDPWCVAPEAFDEQMRWLATEGLAVSLDDVVRFARGERDLTNGAVLVTIDDGFSSVLSIAAPILRRYGVPAVAYVTTSVIGAFHTSEPFLSWGQLAELDAGGMTIGSHGHTHRSMAKLTLDEARAEARRSKDLLETRLGKPVTSFAYAYGMRGDETPATARVLADCGYHSVFVSQHGNIRRGKTDPLHLPRIKVEAGEPLWMFKLLVGGGMDAWGLADKVF
jgi:peptidoglycan/xylan/chitin deacetylase (PgdA/CDA1 family)